jgi:hypothetical protein
MLRVLCTLLLFLFPAYSGAAADSLLVRGTVVDSRSSEPLVAAHIRILGTSRGTITNHSGRFALRLNVGTHRVAISMLGYLSDTLIVTVPPSQNTLVRLEQTDIVLPEFLVTSEDPAYEIIRRAIAAKKQWTVGLVAYEFDAFTRQVFRRDTSIASITESYSKGYWQQGDTLREVVIQSRKTENIRDTRNFAAVGGILNFSDDEIRLAGFTFTGPIAPDAFDYYRYKLLRIISEHGQKLYEIRMSPRTRTAPLFDGIIHIADSSYALVGVDIEPNEAFQFPFVKDRQFRYKQQFALYNNAFWLPVDIRVKGAGSISFPGFSFPRMAFEQTSVIYSYAVNPAIPDSVFRKPVLVLDSSAAKIDTAFWQANQILPLAAEEQEAYSSLDSTQTLDKMFLPRSLTLGGGIKAQWIGTLIKYLDVAYNRVEGFHFGPSALREKIFPWMTLDAQMAYGTADRRMKYLFGGTLYPPLGYSVGFGAEVYRRMDYRPDHGYFGPLINSVSALFGKNDYRDYFESEGWRAYLSSPITPRFTATLSFLSENHSSVQRRANFSILYPSQQFRDNPAVGDGRLRSIRFDIFVGDKPALFDVITKSGLEVTVEHSDPSLVSSDFFFTRYQMLATASIQTIGQGFLFRPSLRVRVGAGTFAGTLPPQRLFDVETAMSGYSPFGVMHGMAVKEYQGTGYVAVVAEHNFRSLPFLALDIPFLYENQIDLITYAGFAHTWGRSNILYDNGRSVIVATAREATYWEAGLAIGRILEILRADFTWRFTAPAGLRFTLGVTQIM